MQTLTELIQERDDLLDETIEKQVKIDGLMLEFCPEDMTTEQIETWERNVRSVEDE